MKTRHTTKFKQSILDQIRSNSDLFAKVATALNIKPVSMPQTLDRNGATLNQYHIVTLVASYLGIKPEEVVEQVPEDSEVKEGQS